MKKSHSTEYSRPFPNLLLSEALGAPGSHQRIRISCYAAPDGTACAAFFKESRMEFDNATNLDRKSGVPGTMMTGFHCFPRRAQPHFLPGRHGKNSGGLCPVFFVPRTSDFLSKLVSLTPLSLTGNPRDGTPGHQLPTSCRNTYCRMPPFS